MTKLLNIWAVLLVLSIILITFIIIRSCSEGERENIKADLEVFPESGTEPLNAIIRIRASSDKVINEVKIDINKDGKLEFEDFPKTKEYSNEIYYTFFHPTGEMFPATVTVVGIIVGSKEKVELEKKITVNPLGSAEFALLADTCSGVPPLEVNFQVVFFSLYSSKEKLTYFWDCDGDGKPEFVNNSTQQTCRFDKYGLYPSTLSVLDINQRVTFSKFIYCGVISQARITKYIEVVAKMEVKKYFALPKQVKPTDIFQNISALVGVPSGIFIVDLKEGRIKNWIDISSLYGINWVSFLDHETLLSATLQGVKLYNSDGDYQLLLEGEVNGVFPFTVTDNFGNSSTFFILTYRFPTRTNFPCRGETCGFFLCNFQLNSQNPYCYGVPLPSEVLSFCVKDGTSKLDVFTGHSSLIKAFRIKKAVNDLKALSSDYTGLIEFERDYSGDITPYIFDAVLDSSNNLKASILPHQASPYFQIFIPPSLESFWEGNILFNTTSFISDDFVFLGTPNYQCFSAEKLTACSGLIFDTKSKEFKQQIETLSDFINSYYESNMLIVSTKYGIDVLKTSEDKITNKSSINFIPNVEDFYLDGSTIYMAAGKGGVLAFDIFSEKFLFHIPTTDIATATWRSGDLIFIGISDDLTTTFEKEGKVIIYDLRTGKRTSYSDQIISESVIGCISSYQDYIILCAGNILKKFSLSFSEIGSLELSGSIIDIKFYNGKIFAMTDKNLYTIDFYTFNIVDTKTTQKQFFQMDIYPERNLLFTAEGADNSFSIWDISGSSPSQITSYSIDYGVMGDIAAGIAHWKDNLYMASEYSGVMVFDIKDPSRPVLKSKTHFQIFSIPVENCYSIDFKLICKSVKDLVVLE